MPTFATILEPRTGDSVASPVVVKAAFTSTAPFNMSCSANGTAEGASQPHNPPSGCHVSAGIVVNGVANFTVTANIAGGAALDTQPGVILRATAPVEVIGVEEDSSPEFPPPAPVPAPVLKGRRDKSKSISGECDPTLPGLTYVVCRVVEIDLRNGRTAVIAVGAAMCGLGVRRPWMVKVRFTMNMDDFTLQYLAQATLYDAIGTSLGTQSKMIEKN